MALIKSIPGKWTQLISTQRGTEIASDQCFYDTIILTNRKLENIHTLISSVRYKYILAGMASKPTAKIKMEQRGHGLSWNQACLYIYTSVDA